VIGARTWCEIRFGGICRTHSRFRGGAAASRLGGWRAAAVLALWGTSADASTRVLIADPVVHQAAGFLGIGLA
jgi:hypothetical protein